MRLAQSSGKSRQAIADDLGVSVETLRLWVKQTEIDAGLRQDGLTTEETEELRRLRRENKLLREEREILVKVPTLRWGSTADGNRGRRCDTASETVRAAEVGHAEWCCAPAWRPRPPPPARAPPGSAPAPAARSPPGRPAAAGALPRSARP